MTVQCLRMRGHVGSEPKSSGSAYLNQMDSIFEVAIKPSKYNVYWKSQVLTYPNNARTTSQM